MTANQRRPTRASPPITNTSPASSCGFSQRAAASWCGRLNRAQRHVHALLEEQRAKTGRVRAIILKGRQQGCSTYVGGRLLHRVTHMRGQHCFILTHEEQATQTLFKLVDVFLKHVDDPPSVSVANANELYFDELNSGYKVATAGTKGVGRSSTVQLFHGSEVALWPHAQTHAAGVMQAVPDLPGTEVILESTALGFGNFFHKLWRDAETGVSDYLPIFVPWYWDDGYRASRRATASRSTPTNASMPRSTASIPSRWRGGARGSPR